MRSLTFEPGRELQLHGERWTVIASAGRTAILLSQSGVRTDVDLHSLITDPTFVPHLRADEYAEKDRVLLASLTPKERAELLEREAVVQEILTGYRSGRADSPQQNEPRDQFHPEQTTLMQRYRKAAEEQKKGFSTIRRMCRAYKKFGLAGLQDLRSEGNRKSQWAEGPVVDAIVTVAGKLARQSTVSRGVFIAETQRYLRNQYPTAPLPSKRTFYRLTEAQSRKHGLHNEAKTRLGKINAPKTMHHPLVASRLGEYVLIDASPWDILLRSHHHPDEARRYRMLVAFDLYHRGIVAFTMHAGEPQAVDATHLLYDTLNPKHLMPGWPEDMVYPYVGVPDHVVLEEFHLGDDVRLSAQGFVTPTNVSIDNGTIFKSRHFQDVCRLMGISIIINRPATPTDKGAVERFFGTIERDFAARLPGYVGHNMAHRGEEPDLESLHWVDEFEAAFLRYYCTGYLKRGHKGLFHPDYPQRKFSPAEMFDLGLRTGGLVRVPLDPDIYYQLLPTLPRLVSPEGVAAFGLRYDHPELDGQRDDQQKYAFAHDPRDLRYLYHRTKDGRWLQLLRKPARFPHLPFTPAMLRAARTTPDPNLRITAEEASMRLDDIIRDMENVTRKRKRTRQDGTAAARLDRAQRDRDRMNAPLPIDPPTPKLPPTPSPLPVVVNLEGRTFATVDDDTSLADLFDD